MKKILLLLTLCLPPFAQAKDAICGLELPEKYAKLFTKKGHDLEYEKRFYRYMRDLKFYWIDNENNAYWMIGKRKLQANIIANLKQHELAQEVELYKKQIEILHSDRLRSIKSGTHFDLASKMYVEIIYHDPTQLADYYEYRTHIFQSPECRIDILVTGKVDEGINLRENSNRFYRALALKNVKKLWKIPKDEGLVKTADQKDRLEEKRKAKAK